MGVVWVPVRRVGVRSNPNGKKSVLRTLAVVVSTFVGFLGMIITLRLYNLISPQVALLMLIALLGLKFGFGVLVAACRPFIGSSGIHRTAKPTFLLICVYPLKRVIISREETWLGT